MSDNLMSRRKFLAGTGLVLGAASVSGVALLKDADPAAAAGAVIPWPYPTDPAQQPDPEAVARRAFEIYFKSGCAEAVWYSCVEALAAVPGMDASYWASLPANIFRFGGGGVAGWGTICGTLNGAAAFISMAVGQNLAADGVTKEWTHRNNLINGAFQYYAETPLPTNDTYKSSQGVLGALRRVDACRGAGSRSDRATPPRRPRTLRCATPRSSSGRDHRRDFDQSPQQRDRCGKACFDVARKTISLLNTYFELASAPGRGARSERRRVRCLPQDVHGRQDGLRLLPRQHGGRRPHELSEDRSGRMIRNGASPAPLRRWRYAQ